MLAVGGGDPARFLPAMLQRVKAPVGEAGGVGVVVDGHHAALLAEFVEGGGVVPVHVFVLEVAFFFIAQRDEGIPC